MEASLLLTVLALGLVVSFFSGLLGIGGGIILTPLLLYLPPALGVGQLGMREVAGLTIVQGLAGALSGVIRHRGYGFVSRRLVAYMGATIAASSLVGAVLSRYVQAFLLLAVFTGLAFAAAALMLLPRPDEVGFPRAESVDFSRPLAVAIAATVGFLGGLVGQGGAFILIPLMLHVLRVPTRVTIGSSLGIVLCSALAGFLGKLGTGQVDPALGLVLALGAVPGGQIGARVSKGTPPVVLRRLLALLILLSALKMGSELLLAG